MEPAKAKIVIPALVKGVEQRKRSKWVAGHGKDATFEEINLGYYVLLEGSHEALFVGFEYPPFTKGDMVQISIEKTT